jgi:ABC-type nitrate/sulfonate/bicarbonate transport system substrate-binding protein
MEPYGDHTYAIIGVKNGWFKEVGIDLQYQCVKTDDVVPYLLNGTLDVASCPPGFLFSSYENAPNLVTFVFNDIFQGYGIMAQPSGGFKSYSDFVKEGRTAAEALRSTVAQMRGKVFAYPAETAIKPFVDVVLRKGGLTHSDVKSLVLDDPLTINAMRQKQADFQVGGAPSRVILLREGFKCILSANDIALSGKPSADSPELASILEDGWATTRGYYEKNYDIILRLAAVNFRILRFMNEHTETALSVHMPYLSQVTGQPFSLVEGRIIYRDLDPFITFEKQREWFHNPQNTYFYKNVNGSILNNFVNQGIYKRKPPKVDDIIVASQVYLDLEQLKDKSGQLLAKIARTKANMANKESLNMYQRARHFYENYDFLDALKIAQELANESSGH